MSLRSMMGIPARRYRVICLKRTEWANRSDYEYLTDWFNASKVVYWRANARGYTSAREGAGLYTSQELDDLCGNTMDWIVEPVNSTQTTVHYYE